MADDVIQRALAKVRDPNTSPETRAAILGHPKVQAYVSQIRSQTHGGENMEDDTLVGADEGHLSQLRADAASEANRKENLEGLRTKAAGERDAATKKGRSGLPWLYDKALSFLPGMKDPAAREALHQAGDSKQNSDLADAGDPAAKLTQAYRGIQAPISGLAAGLGAGPALGTSSGLFGSLARGAASAAAGPYAENEARTGAAPSTGGTSAIPSVSPEAARAASIPAIFGGAIGLASGVPKALRNPESAIGGEADTIKTLDDMRDRGAISKNRTFRTVNDPELAALPRGKQGYYKAAQNARSKIGENTSGDLAAARKEYADGLAAVENDIGDQVHPTDGVMARMRALHEENTVNGVAVDEGLGAALDKMAKMLKKPTGIVSREGQEITAPGATVGEMLKVKRAVDKLAGWGMPATPETRPYRLIAKDLAQEAENIDPRIGALNKKYSAAMGKLEETNDILYGKDAPAVADRAAGRRQAAGKLARVGDDTAAGSLAQEDLDALAESDPRSAAAIRPIREKKALERTRFGLPQISRSPEKWGGSLLEQNLGAAGARVVDPITAQLAKLRALLGAGGALSANPQTPDAAKMIWQRLQGQAGPEENR